MGQNQSDWVTLAEACEMLGVARNTLKKLIREGRVNAYTVDGVVGYKLKRQDVQALIKPVLVSTPKQKKKRK